MKKTLIFVLVLLFLVGVVFAGGFSIYEQGSKATAMGGAFTAQADDPSALFYNPAGIAFQKASLYLETTIIAVNSDLYGANPYPGVGVNESQESQTFYPSNMSIVMPLNDHWVFGLGMYTPFGLETKWENPDTFSGRYISTLAKVVTYRIQPTIAYKANDKFAVALGVNYLQTKVSLEKYIPAINPYTQSVVNVGHVRIDGGYDGAWGVDLGVMFKYIPKFSIGFAYHSEEDVDYTGRAMFDQIPTGYADFDQQVAQIIPFGVELEGAATINYPEQAMFGIATTIIPKCTLEFDIGYIGWDSYKDLPITIIGHPELSTVRHTDWDKSYSYRLGFEYRATENLALRLGYEYDETPQPDREAGPVLPDSDKDGYCFGIGYKSGPVVLDFSYMYLDYDERNTIGTDHIDQFFGIYDNSAHLVGISLKYNF